MNSTPSISWRCPTHGGEVFRDYEIVCEILPGPRTRQSVDGGVEGETPDMVHVYWDKNAIQYLRQFGLQSVLNHWHTRNTYKQVSKSMEDRQVDAGRFEYIHHDEPRVCPIREKQFDGKSQGKGQKTEAVRTWHT